MLDHCLTSSFKLSSLMHFLSAAPTKAPYICNLCNIILSGIYDHSTKIFKIENLVSFCAEHSDIDCHPKKQSLTQQCVLLTERSAERLKTRIMDHKWNLQSCQLRYYLVVKSCFCVYCFQSAFLWRKTRAHLRLHECVAYYNEHLVAHNDHLLQWLICYQLAYATLVCVAETIILHFKEKDDSVLLTFDPIQTTKQQ